MDILLTIAMIFVVMGHVYQPYYAYMKTYSFHVPLLFFISGYFFRPRASQKEKKDYIVGKVRRLLVPYFIYNVIYAAITYIILQTIGVPYGEVPSISNLLITPFIHGHQYSLYAPAWFVVHLFYMHAIFQLALNQHDSLRKRLTILALSFVFAVSAVAFARFVNMEAHQIWSIFARLAFLSFFYYLGFFVKTRITIFRPYLMNMWILAICLAISAWVMVYQHEYYFTMFPVKFFTEYAFAPFITSLVGIYTWYQISARIAPYIPYNFPLLSIGRQSFHIMANHYLVFFTLSLVFVLFNTLPLSTLKNPNYFYQRDSLWWIYVIAGLAIPTIVANFVDKVRKNA